MDQFVFEPSIRLSHHARVRVQQRGIPWWSIELAIHWGNVVVQRGGTERIVIDRRRLRQGRHEEPRLCLLLGMTIMRAPDGTIITVYWDKRM